MSVFIKAIPTLHGEAAERFVKMAEANLARRGSIDFSKEFNDYRKLMAKTKNR